MNSIKYILWLIMAMLKFAGGIIISRDMNIIQKVLGLIILPFYFFYGMMEKR